MRFKYKYKYALLVYLSSAHKSGDHNLLTGNLSPTNCAIKLLYYSSKKQNFLHLIY